MAILIDPDYYTKVRLDQNGNIQDAGFLEWESWDPGKSDIPLHTHPLDHITGDFRSIVMDCLVDFFANDPDSVIEFNFDRDYNNGRGLLTANLKYDGFTLTRNEYGELQAEGGGSGGSSVSSECATHTHLAKDVEDFEEAVKEIIDLQASKLSIDDLRNLIDNTTIIINSKGQLSAVGTAVAEHTHYLKDIVDYVAPKAAALQPMSDLGDGVVYTGVVDMTNLSLGHSVVALNYYLENVVNKRLDLLANQISKVAMTSSNSNALSTFKIDPTSQHNILTKIATGKAVDVYYLPDLRLKLEALPYDNCMLSLEIDGATVDTVDARKLSAPGLSEGSFKVSDVLHKGLVNDMILSVAIPELSDGQHTFRLRYDLGEDVVDYSETLVIDVTNTHEMELSVTDLNPVHSIDGVTYYNRPYEGLWEIKIENLKGLTYCNYESGFDVSGRLKIEDDEFGVKVIENLFNTTPVTYTPSYQVEGSTSEAYQYVEAFNGRIINDEVSEGSVFPIRLPNSYRFNTVHIKGLSDEAKVIMSKGSSAVSSDIYYEQFTSSGRIANVNGMTLTLAEDFDDGFSSIILTIDNKSPLNLNNLSWELFNL